MSNVFKVENLYFKDVLKGINFSLEKATINALTSENGGGKTVLFKSVFGLVESQGLISIDNVIVTKDNQDELIKKLGVCFVDSILDGKTVFLNLLEPLINLNYDDFKAKQQVYEISKKLGIENLLYKNIETLSHSQKKIVLFARSVIHDPKIILVDGLFDSLDSYYREKVINFFKYQKKHKKCTILFTTHNSEDLSFVDNLLIIKNGKILVNDSLEKLMQDQNLFSKNSIKLPFIVDLSYKLKFYNLIDRLIYDVDEMVDEIWQ